MSISMSGVALDASAVLAYLFGEPGASAVAEAIVAGACMSAVNFSEVMSKIADRGVPIDEALGDFGHGLAEAIEIVDFGASEATEAARLRESTRAIGLSLGDRACLALAGSRGIPALTADKQWLMVKGQQIRLIR